MGHKHRLGRQHGLGRHHEGGREMTGTAPHTAQVTRLPHAAKLYIGLVVAIGTAGLVNSLLNWQTTNWPGFVLYIVVSLLASGYKLRLPGITATVSACFVLMMIGILSLSLPE